MLFTATFMVKFLNLNTVVPQGSGTSLMTFSLFITNSVYDSIISIYTSWKLTRSLSNMDDYKVVL